MPDAVKIARLLTLQHGVELSGEAGVSPDGQRVRLWPAQFPPTRGFIIDVLVGWRTLTAAAVLGNYAGAVLSALSRSTADRRATFGVFALASMNDGADVELLINHERVDPLTPVAWPADWRSFALTIQKGPFTFDGNNPDAVFALASKWGGRALCCVLSLLELEPAPVFGAAEGGQYKQLVTRHERSDTNRAACIEIFGPRCRVCGFDFEAAFGDIGCGFIEVHHIEMVSRLEPGTILDPSRDLVPLCANCHRMAHRRSPPFTVAELHEMRRNRNAAQPG